MIEAAELTDNTFLRQFQLEVDNELAKIEYSLQDRKIFLTKLIIPEGINDENFTSEFLSAVFEQIDERNLSIVPTSPAIAKFVRRKRKYKHRTTNKDVKWKTTNVLYKTFLKVPTRS